MTRFVLKALLNSSQPACAPNMFHSVLNKSLSL